MPKKQDQTYSLAMAEQQFLGYAHAKDGYGAVSLAEGMGLTSAEWRELRESVALSDDEMEALDEHFKDS